MTLRSTLLCTRTLIRNSRAFSSKTKLLDVAVDDDGIATMTMNRPPVNSLNAEFLGEFSSVMLELEKNKSRGMILTSSSNAVFSAGLDIMEMYRPTKEKFTTFWSNLQDAWISLYGSSFPTVAVVNGHAPAGGCLLAMSCEYRVMLQNFNIGLNETQLGIVAPPWFMQSMLNTISKRDAELALTTGRLFKADQALKVGLVDELVASKEDALSKARAFLDRFETIPAFARAHTKNFLRGADIKALQKSRQQEVEQNYAFVTQDQVQQSLEMYLAMLKNKKAQQ